MAQSISSETGHGGPGSSVVSGLIEMADYCLSQNPQQIEEAVRCLMASISLSPPPRVEAKVKLQLGMTLYHHTNNLLEARELLEQAMLLSNSVSGIEQIKYEAASILARIHVEQGYAHNAKMVIRSAMETSYRLPYWHCRLMLQKADVHLYEKDYNSLIGTLTTVSDYAEQMNAPHTRILCLLTKGAYLLITKNFNEAVSVLNFTHTLVESYQGPKAAVLNTLYQIIQVTHLLGFGLIKAAKPHMKSLQQCVKKFNNEIPTESEGLLNAECFDWLTLEQTKILIYLVSMMHSVLAGNTEKALSFAKKAFAYINSRKGSSDGSKVLLVFEAHLLELVVSCLLIQGNCTQAGEKLQEAINICHSHSQMTYSHRAVLHTLLGAYAFATNNDERSVAQFQTALQHTNSLELKVFINVNLAMTYLRIGASKIREMMAIMDFLQSEDVNSIHSKNLKCAVSFVKGLNAYHQVRPHEAKRHLRETISLSNSNELSKLSACALLVLGQIFLSLGNHKEAREMLDPASKLTHKISDKMLQTWATSLLIGLHKTVGDKDSEKSLDESLRVLQAELYEDHMKTKDCSHHLLMHWTVGDWPVTEDKKETDSIGKVSPLPSDDRHRAGQYMEVSNHKTDHGTSKSKTTDPPPNLSKVIDQSEPQESNSVWTGHVTDHVTRESSSHERLSHSFQQQVSPEQGHVTLQHRPPKDHMTPQLDHMTSKLRKDVLQSDPCPPNTNYTDHMTPGHMTHQHTKKRTLSPSVGARDIPLDPLIGFVKHSKSEQPSFNQSPVSNLFSPPPTLPTPPTGPYSKHYSSHQPAVSSSPAQFTSTLTPPLSATEVVHTSSSYMGKTSQTYESPLGHLYQQGPSTSMTPSVHQYGSQQQQGSTSRHHSIPASPHLTNPQTQSPSIQYVNTHHPPQAGADYHTAKDNPPPRTSHYALKQQQSQLPPSNHPASQPLQHAGSQYSPLKHQSHSSSASQPVLQSSPPYIKHHTSPQFTASPQVKQLPPPPPGAGVGSQSHVGVQQHQSSPLLHGMPQLRHMGTLPSADSVLSRTYPSPSAHIIDSPNVARGSPSQPGSALASPYQLSSLSLLHHQQQQQQQGHATGLIPQQFPQVYSSSPPQRQLHHQLQQQQHQQFAPNDLVLHQYGYSTLSPEAILRQKLLHHQQQTGPAGSVNFSPLSHPQTHHSPVLMGGGPSPMQYNPRPINVYQYQPPSSVSPPTPAPGHLNYIHHHHHHHMHKTQNAPHQ